MYVLHIYRMLPPLGDHASGGWALRTCARACVLHTLHYYCEHFLYYYYYYCHHYYFIGSLGAPYLGAPSL